MSWDSDALRRPATAYAQTLAAICFRYFSEKPMRFAAIIAFVTFGVIISSSAFGNRGLNASQVINASDRYISEIFTDQLFRKFLKIDIQASYSVRPDSATVILRRPLNYEGKEYVIFYNVIYKMYDHYGNFISDLVVRVENDYSVKDYNRKRLKPYRHFLQGKLEIGFNDIKKICAANGYDIELCTLSLKRKKGKYFWEVQQPYKSNSYDELIIDAKSGKINESHHWVVQY